MDIILLEDVEKVGDKYDVVNVKDGYGRNYLIPQGLALIANDTNMRRLDDYKRREDAKEAKLLGHYQEIAASLADKTLKIGAKAGTSGKIFGSITALQVSQALQEQFQVEIARKKITIPEEAKEIGTFKATLNLHPEVVSELEFEIVAE